jgi:hypothetical protein
VHGVAVSADRLEYHDDDATLVVTVAG